jgi:hypothetical protein
MLLTNVVDAAEQVADAAEQAVRLALVATHR